MGDVVVSRALGRRGRGHGTRAEGSLGQELRGTLLANAGEFVSVCTSQSASFTIIYSQYWLQVPVFELLEADHIAGALLRSHTNQQRLRLIN